MKLVTAEHRQSLRTPLAQPLEAKLIIGGFTYPTIVTDYSITGLGVKVDDPTAVARAKQEGFEIEVTLPKQNHTYVGMVRHSRINENEKNAVLGIHLKISESNDISFLSNDPGWDLIEDPETIQNIFSDLVYKGPEALVSARQFKAAAQLIAKEVKENVLVLEIFEQGKGAFQSGRCHFRFELFQTCHAFEATLLHFEKNKVEIELPKQVARLLRRETIRIQNGENGVKLKVKLKSSILGVSPNGIDVVDFSEHGFSVLEPTGWILAPKGIILEDIELITSTGITVKGKGTIRAHQWNATLEKHIVGIEFETADDDNRNSWHGLIMQARYPSLAFQYEEKDHKEIWELFDRSKYLGLKPRESFNYVYDITIKTWEKMSDSGTKLAKRVMIKKDDHVLGHLQLDRIYPDTWCAHALAIDPKVSKTVGKEIYAVTSDVLSAEGAGYIISITESHLAWNQRNYYDFVKNYRFPEHNELKTFQIHEAETAKGWNIPEYPGLVTRPANKYDLKRIVRYFQIYSSQIERKALGLDEKNLDLGTLDKELKPFGLSRNREFVVGLLNGHFVGFATMESGTTGMSIFGIQDTMYVNILPEFEQDKFKLYDAILEAGLQRYKKMKVPTVNVYVPDMRREELSNYGLKFIWEGVRWISYCSTARRYHAFSQMLYGHLLLKREEIRKRITNSSL